MSNDKFYMSEELEGKVVLDEQPEFYDVENNIFICVLKYGSDILVGSLKYFNIDHIKNSISIETRTSTDSYVSFLFSVENKLPIEYFEISKGEKTIFQKQKLVVTRYSVSDIEPSEQRCILNVEFIIENS